MSTITFPGHLAWRPPAQVGDNVQARYLAIGDVVLIEQHVVQNICTGSREVVARVTCPGPVAIGDGVLAVTWEGAAPGPNPTVGVSLFDAACWVTVLAHHYETAGAAA
jgi:hypothetical protein